MKRYFMYRSCPSEIGLMAEKPKKNRKKSQTLTPASSLENDSTMLEAQQKDKLHQLSCPSEIGLMAEKPKKNRKKSQTLTPASSLENDPMTLEAQQKDKLHQLRVSTIDISDVKNEEESNLGRKISKSNATFHKLFKDLPESENVIDRFKCALHKEVPYHGKMYVTDNYICFYSSILKEIKLVVPVTDVVVLKKQNIAFLVPSALCIKTSEGEKHLFGALRSRDLTFKVLKSVCLNLENASSSTSPQAFTPENSYEAETKILQELNQSSLEDDSQELDTVDYIQDSVQPMPTASNSWFTRVTKKMKSFAAFHESTAFNTLIIIYILLVLLLLISSGYIGLRIVALEEQLMSMGAWPEIHTQSK
ncbi:GRAM domain-containing protein 2A-like isoform X1 [Mobula birostris]|uniref:GRAM domain-containing protein 2A-like isoform X1 n=1 Tax=Mobula birostris TaxID=1983395 RepID=UPI003B28B359